MGNGNTSQWWKIAVCIVGVLMIAGAITYTVMTRNSVSSNAQASNSATSSTAASNKPTSDGVGELNWVKNLNSKYANNDFIFIVLPGNEDLTKRVDQVVSGAIAKIKQDGLAVDVYTLNSQDPEFSVTTDRLAIQKLPAVLLFSATGAGAIVKGDISETKLLQAYLTLVQTCVPGNSGCCPK